MESKLTYKSYNSVLDKLYFPSLGHIHLDLEATKQNIEECWIIGSSNSPFSHQFISLLAGSTKVRNIEIASLKDIDNLFTVSSGLPKIIVNTKSDCELSYSEQIMLEIAEKYDVEIRNITHSQLLYLKRSNEKGNYEKQFFPSWENFLQNNFSQSSQNF